MYCNFYGFIEKPFQPVSNSRYIYLSKNHKEAFAHLLYGINGHKGFIELTGEAGSGKTTVIRTLLAQLDVATHKSALIPAPPLSALELLRSINREFGIPYAGLENGALLDELNRFLLDENRAQRTVVLVLNEAQSLSPKILEQVRLISNLETDSDKLIQIILCGQPELGRILSLPSLRQLAQRIPVSYRLEPLDAGETAAYIRHRLAAAGTTREIFTAGAIRRIHRYSNGFPLLINRVCDQGLQSGFSQEAREIDASLINRALDELQVKTARPFRFPLRPIILACTLLATAIVIALGVRFSGRLTPRTADAPPETNNRRRPSPPSPATPSSPALQPVAVSPGIETASVPLSFPWKQLPVGPMGAFNAVAGLWNVTAADMNEKHGTLRDAAAKSGLTVTPLMGSLSTLQKLDTPAILELNLPGAGRRFLAVTGLDSERVITSPTLADGRSPSRQELAGIWTGRAFVLWRNHQNIPADMTGDTSDTDMIRLQILLIGSGFMTSELSGRYDDSTRASLQAFQKSRGLKADGKPGGLTLFLLYREGGKFAAPRLALNTQR